MTSTLVARLWMVAAGAMFLIVGLVDALRGEWWGALELLGAVVVLLGVVIDAIRPLRR